MYINIKTLSEILKDRFQTGRHYRVGGLWSSKTNTAPAGIVLNEVTAEVGSDITRWDTIVEQDIIPMSEEEYQDLMTRIEDFEEYWRKKRETSSP